MTTTGQIKAIAFDEAGNRREVSVYEYTIKAPPTPTKPTVKPTPKDRPKHKHKPKRPGKQHRRR